MLRSFEEGLRLAFAAALHGPEGEDGQEVAGDVEIADAFPGRDGEGADSRSWRLGSLRWPARGGELLDGLQRGRSRWRVVSWMALRFL